MKLLPEDDTKLETTQVMTEPFSFQFTRLTPADRLDFSTEAEQLNHNIFRFPAKFHPPVARRLIELYTSPGDVILDPFCGSGTALVEALAADRSGIGTDIDPLSVLVTRAKTRRYDLDRLALICAELREQLSQMQEADEALWGDFNQDIGEGAFHAASDVLSKYIPHLPNIQHWFRRRVIIQLASINSRMERYKQLPEYPFVQICFASIIRNSSNADPVPVSGLEVTKHMLHREERGRSVNPYKLLETSISKSLERTAQFQSVRGDYAFARVARADARQLSVRGTGPVDCVITSPPYLTAVDYYRRHTLEMFWLGLTNSVADRLRLMPNYLGRDRVSKQHMNDVHHGLSDDFIGRWSRRMSAIRPERWRAFLHYCDGIRSSFDCVSRITRDKAKVIFVIGDVRFNGLNISMGELFQELAGPSLKLEKHFWYPLANRYMSYERKNGADIHVEHVLVYRAGRA